jgi:MMPL family
VHNATDTRQLAGALAQLPDVASAAPVTTANGVSLIRLIPKSGPADPATTTLVNTIRGDRAAIEGTTGAHILVGGTTASIIDVSAKLSSALPVFAIVVVGLALVLLTFAFRTILVPLKSVLGFLLSMAAALGAQVAMFQWGWGQHIFGITPTQTISFLPIIMLAIIFGLSSDYEVFVVSRIKEDFTINGDARRAVQRGTGLSARVVTAAALIMFAIFAAFMFTSNPTSRRSASASPSASSSTLSSSASRSSRPSWPSPGHGSGTTRTGSHGTSPTPTSRDTGSHSGSPKPSSSRLRALPRPNRVAPCKPPGEVSRGHRGPRHARHGLAQTGTGPANPRGCGVPELGH